MRRKQVALLVAVALAALAMLFLATRTRQPPLLPRDAAHAPTNAVESCEACHGPDGPLPRSREHPLGRDCLRCHGARR